MSRISELSIDNHTIYIEELAQLDNNGDKHDARSFKNKVINWTTDEIKNALKPTLCIWESLLNVSKQAELSELELSLQFEVCLKGEIPVFKIVSTESSAQVAIRFSWKKDK